MVAMGDHLLLKAETSEDLQEWKTALEEALENAPSAGTGQTGISKNEKGENDGSHEQSKDRSSSKSMVLGRPVLLALEDIDGTPSFLEKALRYVEDYGIKVEGILRQAADVELVERRIQDYEQGTDRGSRVNKMRAAIWDTFAQAIIITLLEEYDNIFGEGDMLSDLYSDSYDSGSESEELSDDYEDEDYSSDGSRDSEHASNTSEDDGNNYQKKKAKKKVPIDNIDAISEERDEIFRFETLKADLTKKIESETRHNSILKEELLSKKDALGDRHIALEQEVATLKEQLQKERELRKVLEAGLMMSKKILPLPGTIDDKTKSDLEDIAQAETEVISLQQKVDDLEVQLNHGKVKDKKKDREGVKLQVHAKVRISSSLAQCSNLIQYAKANPV